LGHKVHPIGFRLGVIKDWQSKWYSDTHYAEFVLEDNKLREEIKSKYPEAAISLIEIDRQAKDVTITLYTARPGIVIGRGGQRVDEMRKHLEELIGKRIRLNIQEIRQPELDAYLVARSVAEQVERRVAYRRAMKQAIFRTMQAGAKGIKVSCAGRLGNSEIARRNTSHQGQVPLHTLRADIDYGFTEAHTTLGRIGVKVWIYKGQILPELKVAEVEEKPEEAAPEEAPAEPAEVTTEAVAEEAPVEKPEVKVAEAPPEEAVAAKPEEVTTGATAEEAPVEKPKAKPARVAVKEAPAEKPEAKPARKAAKAVPAEKPEAKPARKAAKATPAEKPEAKPATKKAAKAAPAEKPAKAAAKTTRPAKADEETKPKAKKTTAAKATEEEKPVKPKAKRATKAKAAEPAPDVTPDTEPTDTAEEEAKDAAA